VPNFIAIALQGAYPQICEILRFCYFFIVLSCPGYTFFSQSRPGRTPGRILTVYGLNDASPLKVVILGGLDDDPQFKGFKPNKNPKKRAWLGVFQPNWQNYKIAISPAGKTGSTPHFDTIIEP